MNTILKEIIRLEELQRQSHIRGKAQDLSQEIDHVRAGLPEDVLRHFDHLTKIRRLPVAGLSKSGACGNCHMKLPPADVLNLRGTSILMTCPFCGCFLYGPFGEKDVTP